MKAIVNRYKPATPRVALGLAAIALAAINFTAAIVLPATLDSAGTDAVAACAQARDPGAITVASSRTVEIHYVERAKP